MKWDRGQFQLKHLKITSVRKNEIQIFKSDFD